MKIREIYKEVPLIILMLFTLSGCGNTNAEDNDIETLKSFSLTENQSQAFYDYVKSTKSIFSTMETINSTQKDNNYIVNNDDYNTVKENVENAIDSYSALNPKNDNQFIEYFEDDSHSANGNPITILDRIEKYKREYSEIEAVMMYDTYYDFAEKGLKSNKLSDENMEDALNWYDNFNDYNGTMKDVYEYRKENR